MNSTDNNTQPIYPLYELLDSFGILPVDIYIYEIIIPIIASIGIVLCLISTRILFEKIFTSITYVYFRVIAISYIVQLMFAIPYGVCFTPKYFPSMNSYSCAIVQCAYIPYSYFASNFNAILDIAILFETIKIIKPSLNKCFTIKPKKMILITFVLCVFLNAIYALVYVPFKGGNYYYYDKNGRLRVNSVWYVSSSNLATSQTGSVILLIFYLLRDVVLTVITIILNIYSVSLMRDHFKTRDNLIGQTFNLHSISFQPAKVSANDILASQNENVHPIVFRKVNASTNTFLANKNERRKKSQKNAIKLVVTRCVISILVRGCVAACDFYYLFSPDYIATILGAIGDLALVVGPTISFFVFYHFNRDFRKSFIKIFSDLDKKFQRFYVQTETFNPYRNNSFF